MSALEMTEESSKEAPAGVLLRGTPAPPFQLHVTPDQMLSLSELRGKPVILAFYPADWSPVCGDEMTLLKRMPSGIPWVRG